MEMIGDLGQKRLLQVHSRVEYLAEKLLLDDLKGDITHNMCEYCEVKEDLCRDDPIEERRQFFINCSGHAWICSARDHAIKPNRVTWNKYKLMTQSDYLNHVHDIWEKDDPRIAIQTMKHFNKELKMEQPHMQNISNLMERIMFCSYKPYALPKGRVVLTEVGNEFSSRCIRPL